MARVIQLASQSSVQMKIGDRIIKLCGCGLSKNFPHCDGSHHQTRDEDPEKLYEYAPDGSRKVVQVVRKD